MSNAGAEPLLTNLGLDLAGIFLQLLPLLVNSKLSGFLQLAPLLVGNGRWPF